MTKTTKTKDVIKENNNSKQIIIALALLIVLILCIILSIKTIKNYNDRQKNNNSNQNELIKNQDVLKDAIINPLKITNVNIGYSNDISSYRAIITNTGSSDYHLDSFYVIFTQNNQDEKVLALTDLTIKAGENQLIDIILDHDITKIDKINYSFK